jgi:hypothetical protein
MKYRKEKAKLFRDLVKDVHDETCLCRRCRARCDAIERRSIRLDLIRNSDDARDLIQHTEDD